MVHLGWLFGIGGTIGGFIVGIYGPVGKYSVDRANELKELIVRIRRALLDAQPKNEVKDFSVYAFLSKIETRPHSVVRAYLDFASR